MNYKFVILAVILNPTVNFILAQDMPFSKAKITFSTEIRQNFIKGGRMLLYFTIERGNEPRYISEVSVCNP